MVANFRSYEGQLRLLTAVVAAHPELKLNYKETAKHYGSDWTESGIEHFFRPIKKNGKALQEHVRRGEDAKNFTHQAFQFRAIKADANALRQGKEPSTLANSTPKTPKTPGGRKRAAPSTGKSTGSKRAKQESAKQVIESLDGNLDDDSGNEVAPLDLTPTKSRINEQKMREYQQAQGWHLADPPALESAQAAATPEEDDDVKIVTPADAGPSFSFAQRNNRSTSAGSCGMPSWDANPFYSGNSYVSGEAQKAVEFDDDDEPAGEC